MKKFLWALLLAAACQPPIEPEPAIQRQALGGVPPGAANIFALPAGTAGDKFGHALAWGDFNKDGVVDLAVGAPGVSSRSGRVYVYFGPLLAPNPASTSLSAAAPGSPTPEFGTALAVTDFNSDGIDDLVVGAPGVMTLDGGTTGAAYFFAGGGGGLSGALEVRGDMLTLGDGARAGSALAGVRPRSVWVGAKDAAGGGGAAVLVTGFGPEATIRGQPGDLLGASLLSFEIDGQGKRDLLAAAPGAQTFRGALVPFIATATAPTAFDAGTRTLGASAGERFGEVLAAVDSRVIAIGSPALDPVNARGRFAVATVNPDGTLDMIQRTDGQVTERLGSALAASDMNGDLKPELYVGAPGANRVASYDPYTFTPLGAIALNQTGAGNGCFGCAIAGGVNAFGDPADDLAVGAEDYADGLNGFYGGAVMLYAGDAGGVNPLPVDGGAATDAGTRIDGGTRTDGGMVPAVAIELVANSGNSITVRPSGAINATTWLWDFGDMTPPVVMHTNAEVPHEYAIPGGYRVRLGAVTAGGTFEADRQVLIADRFGNLPPTMLCAQKNAVTPVPDTFDLTVVAQTDDPGAEVMIDFSEGPVEQSASTTRSFTAGARRVHCYAKNVHGLFAHDSVMARLGDTLPTCRMSFVPPAGEGPLAVQHFSGQDASGSVTNRLTGEDGILIEEGGFRTYGEGLHHATAEAALLGGGRCVDRGRIFVYARPVITSTPPQLGCGQPLRYVVQSEGGEPQLSAASAGVTFDAATQTVTAPALLKSDVVSFDVTVANPYAETTQKVSLPVFCSDRLSFDTPVCGCSGGAAGPLGLMLLAFAARRRRR